MKPKAVAFQRLIGLKDSNKWRRIPFVVEVVRFLFEIAFLSRAFFPVWNRRMVNVGLSGGVPSLSFFFFFLLLNSRRLKFISGQNLSRGFFWLNVTLFCAFFQPSHMQCCCNIKTTAKKEGWTFGGISDCDPTKTIESRVYVLFSDHLLMSRLSLDFVLLSSFCFIGWWWLAIRTCYAAQRTVVVNKESISSNSHKYWK